MSNNFRRKITDLPVCSDVNELDTLIGLGTDGNTYRVDKTIIPSSGGGSNHVQITDYEFNFASMSTEINIGENANMNMYVATGGILHIIYAYYFDGAKMCKDFPITMSAITYDIVDGIGHAAAVHTFAPGINVGLKLQHDGDYNEVYIVLTTFDNEQNMTEDIKSNFDAEVLSIYFEQFPELLQTPPEDDRPI